MITASLIFACGGDSDTVLPIDVYNLNTGTTTGAFYPQIQLVYPGGLQTSTTPEAVPTGIDPTNPGIIVTFSETMENDGGEMDTLPWMWIELQQGGFPVVGTTVSAGSSNFFTVTPPGILSDNTVYSIIIQNSAYVDNDSARTLTFDNLLNLFPPATTTVEYQFQTGTVSYSSGDTTAPTFTSTNPANGASGIAIDLSASNGYIEIILNDNVTPMIDPATVKDSSLPGTSITLNDGADVAGSVVLVTADADLKTYHFIPDTALAYNILHTLTISVGNAITDRSGNALPVTTVIFTTAAESAPAIDSYSVSGIGATTATIDWSLDRSSIGHIDLEPGTIFPGVNYVSPPDLHNTTKAYSFTHNATGLTANTLYSFMIAADTNAATTSAGPFDATATYNAVFRTQPDTTEGATGNYQLGVENTSKSSLTPIQTAQNTSFIFWINGATEVRGQYLDTSAGTADTWDKWPNTTNNNGSQAFSSGANAISAVFNNTDGAILTRINSGDSDIYADSIYNNGGAIGWHWTGAAGTLIYQGTAVESRAALTGYVQELSAVYVGNADLEYIYDSGENFSGYGALDVGDHVINESVLTGHATVNSFNVPLLQLGGVVISSGNLNYRLGDNDITESDTENGISGGGTIHTDANLLDQWDIITNGTNYTYLTSNASGVGPYDYTVNTEPTFVNLDALITYDLITSGTAETNTLYDSGVIFATTYSVQVGDVVVNDTTGHGGRISDVTYADNGLLILDTLSTAFPFAVDNTEQYALLRPPSGTTYITCGQNTAQSGASPWTITQAGRNFATDGVAAGDILYNIDDKKYARVESVAGNTITLSSQAFTGTRNFIVYRYPSALYNGVTFAWQESDNIYGKTADLTSGTLVLPDAIVTGRFTITDNAENVQHPWIISDETGNAIVVYEIYNTVNSVWDIAVKKIGPDGSFVWTDALADANGDAGISVIATAGSDDIISKVIDDGSGGAWAVYQTGSLAVGVAHITTGGAVATFSIGNAANPDVARISATNIAVAYEALSADGARIYVQLYERTTPGASGIAIGVRSSVSNYTQYHPRVIADGSDGAIVSWIETAWYPSIYYTLYAQHFSSGMGLIYLDDKFVAVPVLDTQGAADPETMEHCIIRYNDGGAPNAGVFFWLDERSATNPNDIYFQNVSD